MDDETGWHELLVGVWSPRVRDAVVAHVERATVGARCLLVHTLHDPDQARPGWIEQLHGLVIEGIFAETGAHLDELGSQAAWEAYEEVWEALAARWSNGGGCATVPLRREPDAVALLARLTPLGAQAAGMDVGSDPPEPLWVAGRLRVDAEGLAAYRGLAGVDEEQRRVAASLLALLRP